MSDVASAASMSENLSRALVPAPTSVPAEWNMVGNHDVEVAESAHTMGGESDWRVGVRGSQRLREKSQLPPVATRLSMSLRFAAAFPSRL